MFLEQSKCFFFEQQYVANALKLVENKWDHSSKTLKMKWIIMCEHKKYHCFSNCYSEFADYVKNIEQDIKKYDKAVGNYFDFLIEYERRLRIKKFPLDALLTKRFVCLLSSPWDCFTILLTGTFLNGLCAFFEKRNFIWVFFWKASKLLKKRLILLFEKFVDLFSSPWDCL